MKALTTILFVSTLFAFQTAGFAQQSPLPLPKGPKDMLPDPNNPAGKGKGGFIKYALIMPDDKTAERVKDTERNPFGRNEDEKKGITVKASNEENVIREQLLKLRVVGASPDERGMRVMLGDMVLSSDQIMPPILQEQTLFLKVGRITREAIELVWVEKKDVGLPPRKLVIPMDLTPKVRYQLMGQPLADSKKASTTEAQGRKLGQQVQPGLTQIAKTPPAKKAVAENEAPAPTPAESPVWDPAAQPVQQTAKLNDVAADQAPIPSQKDSTPTVTTEAPATTAGATAAGGSATAAGPADAESPRPAGTGPEALAPLKKAFELFNALTKKPVSDKQ
jgi:hypothetical protein